MPLRRHRSVARLAVVALCIAAAGCGGDDGPSEAEEQAAIATAVRLAATSDDVKQTCETYVTTRFVRDVYGSAAACRKENKPDPDEKTVEKVAASAMRVDGDDATTALKFTVDAGTVASGRVALVKHAGDWKLDRFGQSWMRSLFKGFPKLAGAPAGASGCFARVTRGLSSSDLRRYGNALIGGRLDDLPAKMIACLVDKTIGRAALEQGVEQGLREEGEVSEVRLACVNRRLRDTVTDDEAAGINGQQLSRAVRAKITRAILSC